MSRIFQECLLTEKQALESVDRWKRALSLNEWEIFLYFTKTSELSAKVQEENSSTRGWLNPDYMNKTAILCVIDPTKKQRIENMVMPWDMEKTIVHELLHIHFAQAFQFYDRSPKRLEVTLEQTIELTAAALVAAYRQEI